jgi:hypothetical protein
MSYDFSKQLATLEAERLAIKAEQARLAQETAETEQRQKLSKASFDRWVAKEVDRRITLGGITPKLVETYLETSDNPESLLWELCQQALNSPVYGFELTAQGFRFNGLEMTTITELSKAINQLLGDFGPYNGPEFLEALIYANVKGLEHPVSWAVANINVYPTDLEPEESQKLWELTGYHRQLSSLMPGSVARPDLAAEVAPVVDNVPSEVA